GRGDRAHPDPGRGLVLLDDLRRADRGAGARVARGVAQPASGRCVVRRATWAYGAALVVAAGAAVQTWTRDTSVEPARQKGIVWQAAPADVQGIELEGDARSV